MPLRTEEILIEQARSGHEQAFAQLVELHCEKVTSLAWRLVGRQDDAEEIAQEAFLRLYRSLPSFRGEASIATWLYRTTSRLAVDHLRHEKLKRKLFFFRKADAGSDPLELAADRSGSPYDALVARETAEKMQHVLDELPARQKAVFVLRHLEGMPLKEIAEILGLQEGTVKAHLHRAVSRFREVFRKEHGDLP